MNDILSKRKPSLFQVVLIFYLYFFNLNNHAQNFAPLNFGNIWIWENENGKITKSTITDTNYFYNDQHYYRITYGDTSDIGMLARLKDDSLYVYYELHYPYLNHEIPYYKRYAALGDFWTYPLPNSNTAKREITEITILTIFGKEVQAKTIYINLFLVDYLELWTEEFGLISGTGSLPDPYFTLRGCVINGVVYGDTNTIVGINDQIDNKSLFYLFQNYPNPFNLSTKIRFYIENDSQVRLTIFDIIGREIKVLINEIKHPGLYSLEFNGKDLISGIYFYTITNGGETKTRKMLLLK